MPQVRRRDALLQALELAAEQYGVSNLSTLRAFLYIAENPNIHIAQLAYLTGMHDPTASRISRAMAGRDERDALAPYLGLLTLSKDPANGRKRLGLSERGARLCEDLDAIIANAQAIQIKAS